MNRKIIIACFSILMLVVLPIKVLQAQNIEYGVMFDTTRMLIGDQQNLRFIVRSDQPLSVSFPNFQDTIVNGVEIVSGPKIDSSLMDNLHIYEQSYLVTMFDTGIYVIPPQKILFQQQGFDNSLTTDTIMVQVGTMQVDMEKGGVDIEGPYGAPITFMEILPWILLTIAVVGVVLLLIYLFRRFKRGEKIFGKPEPVIPPYDVAVAGMTSLKSNKLWEAGHEKQFYSELTDILRRYLSGELGLQCMESTSPEIYELIKTKPLFIDERDVKFIVELLTDADLVKFAKSMPLQSENVSYLDGTTALIDRVHLKVEEDKKLEQ